MCRDESVSDEIKYSYYDSGCIQISVHGVVLTFYYYTFIIYYYTFVIYYYTFIMCHVSGLKTCSKVLKK